jgi:hypothetical protein
MYFAARRINESGKQLGREIIVRKHGNQKSHESYLTIHACSSSVGCNGHTIWEYDENDIKDLLVNSYWMGEHYPKLTCSPWHTKLVCLIGSCHCLSGNEARTQILLFVPFVYLWKQDLSHQQRGSVLLANELEGKLKGKAVCRENMETNDGILGETVLI